MSYMGVIRILTVFAALLTAMAGRAAEFEILDRFSVDGYSLFRGSADIPGGGFAVGVSTFVVKYGNVGIGTTGPASKLDVAGGAAIGAAYSGTSAAPSNGLIVEGNVGIGTTNPAASLDVAGGIKLSSVTACASDTAGTLRWYDGHISVCNGSAWRQLDNQAPPTISEISPASGLFSLQTAITIDGTGFAAGAEVTVDGVAATAIAVLSTTRVTATTPAGTAGLKAVRLTNPDGQYITGDFTYNPSPTITGISPASGSGLGGTPVTITGTGFATGAGITGVTIGGADATDVVRFSATEIRAKTPGSSTSGAKDVRVTNPDTGWGELTGVNGFTYKVYATGGSIDEASVSGYRIHTFTASGTFTVVTGGSVEYLVVAGGGSGGTHNPGGGGGGGALSGTLAVTTGAKTITIGSGGAGVVWGTSGNRGNNGGDSVFDSLTAKGGGAGGGGSGSYPPTVGGTGGGGGSGESGAAGTSGQGYAGGDSNSFAGGGGGGAGAAGSNATANCDGGNGGAGLQSSISGTTVYYGGGGGGATIASMPGGYGGYTSINGTGGSGGGTAGNANTSTSAAANTGGGSGAADRSPGTSGNGGSGIVIVRYLK